MSVRVRLDERGANETAWVSNEGLGSAMRADMRVSDSSPQRYGGLGFNESAEVPNHPSVYDFASLSLSFNLHSHPSSSSLSPSSRFDGSRLVFSRFVPACEWLIIFTSTSSLQAHHSRQLFHPRMLMLPVELHEYEDERERGSWSSSGLDRWVSVYLFL